MRLLRLEITNVRGIRHLVLNPQGDNELIYGPNGVGKSSVVDAIDFLLTGNIARLSGVGTKGVTLASAGPTFGCDAGAANVYGEFVTGMPEVRVAFRRCLATPHEIVCEDSDRSLVNGLLSIAQKGQTILTRRNILEYIAEEPKTRAVQIQSLLNLQDVERLRTVVVEVTNRYDKELERSKAVELSNKNNLLSVIDARECTPEAVRDYVNVQRKLLGGPPLTLANSSNIKEGISPPSEPQPTNVVDVTALRSGAAQFTDSLADQPDLLLTSIVELNTCIQELTETLPGLPDARTIQLARLGLVVLGDGTDCPLCETPWPPGTLQKKLESRIGQGEAYQKTNDRLEKALAHCREKIDELSEKSRRFAQLAQSVLSTDDQNSVALWTFKLDQIWKAAKLAQEKLSPCTVEDGPLRQFLLQARLREIAAEAVARAGSTAHPASPTQIAWDSLTRLGQALSSLEKAQALASQSEYSSNKSHALLRSFIASRDAVLSGLYNSVRDRFVSLYRRLHILDEPSFSAELQPNNAGLDLTVDFLGHAMAPPLAFHSEGHQDSMGICLYLALADRISMDKVHFTVLDDVVMSVDVNHRRELCGLLRDEFPGHQFILTTHDRTWAQQLRDTGTVRRRNCVEFSRWTFEAGPYDAPIADMWVKVDEALEQNDISGAAANLRRGTEEFLQTVCDALHAEVPFKRDFRYDLGDLCPAALKRYKFLLQQALRSAQSWSKPDLAQVIADLEITRHSVAQQLQEEQGMVNPAVHYNDWADLSPGDLRPVVGAYRNLYELFFCPTCGSVIEAIPGIGSAEMLKCHCGETDLNLVQRQQ